MNQARVEENGKRIDPVGGLGLVETSFGYQPLQKRGVGENE